MKIIIVLLYQNENKLINKNKKMHKAQITNWVFVSIIIISIIIIHTLTILSNNR
jgi:hypothetical protein